VHDVVNANILALNEQGPSVYNVGTSVETDVNFIFRMINEYAGKNFTEKHGPPKLGEQKRSVLSFDKINKTLGWEPKTGIEKGLEATIKYYSR
jgi:UDP-glucose 4-epimerase